MVSSRNMQGEESLQHQARLPKQVCFPSERGVSLDIFLLQFNIFLPCHAELIKGGDEGAVLDRHAAEGEGTDVAPPADLFGRIVPAVFIGISGYGCIKAGRVCVSSDFRASDTMSAPWDNISFIRSKVSSSCLR